MMRKKKSPKGTLTIARLTRIEKMVKALELKLDAMREDIKMGKQHLNPQIKSVRKDMKKMIGHWPHHHGGHKGGSRRLQL
jgi:hypothetical protein